MLYGILLRSLGYILCKMHMVRKVGLHRGFECISSGGVRGGGGKSDYKDGWDRPGNTDR